MGHDIHAKKISDGSEISYLRISAGSRPKANLFYASIDSQEFDAGVSGAGGCEQYDRDEIKLAIQKLKYLEIEDQNLYVNPKADEMQAKMLGVLVKALGGKFPSVSTAEDFKHAVEDITRFFTEIIESGEEIVVIEFY